LSEQALALARELGAPVAEAKILWGLLDIYIPSNRLPQALACGEQAVALARSLNLREQTAFILNDGAKCYWLSGHLDRARESLQEASDLWRELNNLPMLADSLASSVELALWVGDYNLALTFSEEAFQISQSIANLWGQSHSKIAVGYIYWDRGQPDQAIAVMQECLHLSELAHYITPQVLTRVDLATVYGSLGALEQGLQTARPALAVAETHIPILRPYVLTKLAQLHLQHGQLSEAGAAIEQGKKVTDREVTPIYFQFVILAEAELALRQGNHERALLLIDDVVATLNQFGMRAYIPEALYLRGQILKGMGQVEAAHKAMLEAQAEAEAIGSRRMLWQILFALSRLESNPIQAKYLGQQAREIVQFIADNISNAELRASFLGSAEIQQVLSE
jgi:tetratricopeptide (TPR) repeat protein